MKLLFFIIFCFACSAGYKIEKKEERADCLNKPEVCKVIADSKNQFRWMLVIDPKIQSGKTIDEIKIFWKEYSEKLSDKGMEEISEFNPELKDRIYALGYYKNIKDFLYDLNLKKFDFSIINEKYLSTDIHYQDSEDCRLDPYCDLMSGFKYLSDRKCYKSLYITCLCPSHMALPLNAFATDNDCNCWHFNYMSNIPSDWKREDCKIDCYDPRVYKNQGFPNCDENPRDGD